MSIKIYSAILCDLVRTEDNGKHIIIGVYTGDIVFTKCPTTFRTTLWLEMEPWIKNGGMPFDIRLEATRQKKPVVMDGEMKIADEDRALLVLLMPVTTITSPGEYTPSLRKRDRRWQKIISKAVELLSVHPPA